MNNPGKPQLVILPAKGKVPPKFKRITSLRKIYCDKPEVLNCNGRYITTTNIKYEDKDSEEFQINGTKSLPNLMNVDIDNDVLDEIEVSESFGQEEDEVYLNREESMFMEPEYVQENECNNDDINIRVVKTNNNVSTGKTQTVANNLKQVLGELFGHQRHLHNSTNDLLTENYDIRCTSVPNVESNSVSTIKCFSHNGNANVEYTLSSSNCNMYSQKNSLNNVSENNLYQLSAMNPVEIDKPPDLTTHKWLDDSSQQDDSSSYFDDSFDEDDFIFDDAGHIYSNFESCVPNHISQDVIYNKDFTKNLENIVSLGNKRNIITFNNRRCQTTTMVFSTELQDRSSHEALIKLQDTEIRLLDAIQKCVTQRVKCDREYAQSLLQLSAISNKFDNPDNFISPVFRAWKTIVTETENIAKQIKSNADRMCTSTISKLVDLVAEKKQTRKLYIDERNRLEQELNKLKDTVQKHKRYFEKSHQKLTLEKAKYEDAVAKGKTGKKLEDATKKYRNSTADVHLIHNQYVASLQEISLQQDDNLQTVLPGLLDYQQEIQQSMVQQCKDILQEYTSRTDFSCEEYVKYQGEIAKDIGAINPSTEHDEFLNTYRSEPLQPTKYEFDQNLLADSQINLEPGVIALNDLTLDDLKLNATRYQVEIKSLQVQLEGKKQKLKDCEDSLSKLPPLNTMNDADKQSYYSHKKLGQQLRKDINELDCHEQKYQSLYSLLNNPVSNLTGNTPSGCVLSNGTTEGPDRPLSETKSQSSFTRADPGHSSSNLANFEEKAQIAKDKFNTFKKSLADKFKKQQGGQTPPEPLSKDYKGTTDNDGTHENNSSLSSPTGNTKQDGSNSSRTNVSPVQSSAPVSIADELKARHNLKDICADVNSPIVKKQPPATPAKPTTVPVLKYEQCEISTENRVVKSADIVARPIQEEDWFHGVLPREEVVRLLKDDGDYLVRESKSKKSGGVQHVLSVMWNDPKHFIIQGAGDQWRFEGNTFNSIQELIRDQHSSGLAVTKKSQAILKKAILREPWELSNDEIILGRKLGNGNFGDVFMGNFKDTEVAVKTCKETLSEDQKKKFLQEGRILKQYDHPNIVRFIGIAAQRQPVMIVMEYVAGGALLSFLRTEGKKSVNKLGAKQMVKMCADAAAGMAYLEERGCIHRDLAARNCLVGKDNVVKISDFGMSREEEEYTVSGGLKQIPIKWTAPEALNYGTYTTACDVWSFGILVWEVFSFGATPYPGFTNNQARERVDEGYRMPCPDMASKEVHELMLRCWEAEPKDRLKFGEVHSELIRMKKIIF